MRAVTKRYILPAIPVAVLVSATAIAAAGQHQHSVTVTTSSSGSTSSGANAKPQVSVNGQKLDVPDNGTTTLSQGDTKTTVTHQDQSGSQPGDQTTTTGGSNTVHISVTSNTNGQSKFSHNHVFFDTGGGTTSSSHSSVNVTSHGTGTINVSQ